MHVVQEIAPSTAAPYALSALMGTFDRGFSMRRAFFATIACVFAAAPLSGATLSQGTIDAWDIGAYSSDRTGQFSHCATSASYRSGVHLLFAIGRDYKWSMGLANAAWKLTPGAEYQITYQIDNFRPIAATATVIDSSLATVELVDSQALFAAFQRGWLLTIRAAGEVFTFSLKSSSKALAATLACTQRHLVVQSSNPFLAGEPGRPHQSSTDPSLKGEAAAIASNLLSSAGVSGFQLVSEIPEELSYFHAIWFAPGLAGGVVIYPDTSVSDGLAVMAAQATARCKGKFASAKLPSSDDGASIKSVCESDGKMQQATYVVLRRRSGGIYALVTTEVDDSTTSQAGAGAAERAATGFIDASVKVLGR